MVRFYPFLLTSEGSVHISHFLLQPSEVRRKGFSPYDNVAFIIYAAAVNSNIAGRLKVLDEAAERWGDNVMAIRGWMVNKKNMESKRVGPVLPLPPPPPPSPPPPPLPA